MNLSAVVQLLSEIADEALETNRILSSIHKEIHAIRADVWNITEHLYDYPGGKRLEVRDGEEK